MAQQQNRLHNAIRLDGGVAAAFRQLQALFANNPDKPDKPDNPDRPSKSDRSSNPDNLDRSSKSDNPDNPDKPSKSANGTACRFSAQASSTSYNVHQQHGVTFRKHLLIQKDFPNKSGQIFLPASQLSLQISWSQLHCKLRFKEFCLSSHSYFL